MGKKKQAWEVEDVFLVKIPNETYVVGQIVGCEPEVLNSVSIALFDEQTNDTRISESLNLNVDSVFSVLFTTRDLLDSGTWQVIGKRPVALPRESFPYESLRSEGFVGAKIKGSANVHDFVSAYYGLLPWDNYKNPNYFDEMLISPKKKPNKLIYKVKI